MPASRAIRFLLALLGVMLALMAGAARPVPQSLEPAGASLTFAVTSPTDAPDANPGDGVCASTASGACTLRAAIEEANAAPAGSTITITVPARHYVLTLGELELISNTIRLASADAATTVDAGGASRVVHVHGSSVVQMSGVTLTGGHAGSGDGGGVLNEGSLVLMQSTIISNTAASGGGLTNSGVLTLDSSSVISNSTAAGTNSSNGGDGGGVFNSGSLTVTASTISGNATGSGGNSSRKGGNGGNGGGVLNSGSLTIAPGWAAPTSWALTPSWDRSLATGDRPRPSCPGRGVR
jgi:CSLREA domain-containing protein